MLLATAVGAAERIGRRRFVAPQGGDGASSRHSRHGVAWGWGGAGRHGQPQSNIPKRSSKMNHNANGFCWSFPRRPRSILARPWAGICGVKVRSSPVVVDDGGLCTLGRPTTSCTPSTLPTGASSGRTRRVLGCTARMELCARWVRSITHGAAPASILIFHSAVFTTKMEEAQSSRTRSLIILAYSGRI